MRVALVVLATLFVGSFAHADPEADATAQALFRKGRELVQKGDWDAGCEQFRASAARFEAASTVLNLARCAEHFGRVASAWALYQRGQVLAREEPAQRRAELEKLATDGIQAMEPRLPRLRVEVKSPPEGLELLEAERPLPLGVDVPLDPGKHELVLRAPGFISQKQSVELEEGKTRTLSVELVKSEPEIVEPPAPVTVPPPPKPVERDRPAPAAPPEKIPTWAWVSGAAGIVLTGAAVVFALDAKAQSDELENKCGADFVCNEDLDFDPDATNSRKNRDLGLAVGLGSAGLIGIGIAIFGITNPSVHASARATPSSIWLSGSASFSKKSA